MRISDWSSDVCSSDLRSWTAGLYLAVRPGAMRLRREREMVDVSTEANNRGAFLIQEHYCSQMDAPVYADICAALALGLTRESRTDARERDWPGAIEIASGREEVCPEG